MKAKPATGKIHPPCPVRFLLYGWMLLTTTGLSIPLHAQDERQIEILGADYMEYDRSIGSGVVKYIGDVAFKQEDMLLYCDSAWFFTEENVVHAYDSVHIIQGDTLHLFGDRLKYSGNEKLAEVRHNVTLIDKETVLTTHYLDFDLGRNIGYYEHRGHIVNGDNILDSKRGYYYSRSKTIHFMDSVVIVNPEYTIYADTLRYHTVDEIAYFLGPTEIISPDNYIYCENGWYDTKKNISQFNENSYLESSGQYLRGDSLYYERERGMGMAFDNVELYDSANEVILRGRYAVYFEEPEYAMLTDSTLLIQISDEDSLFVHADTLKSTTDSTGIHKILRAYYHVKIFSGEMQGKCDSLTYLEQDSVFYLSGEPVIWSKSYQLTATNIEVHMAYDEPDFIDMRNSAFIVSQNDSIRFTQIRGRDMVGYFKEGELSRIDVNGNGQTIYFARDEEQLIGVNKAESSRIAIHFKEGELDRINMISAPTAVLHPPFELPIQDLYLNGFLWLIEHRPMKMEDIYKWLDTK
jgi:lipopolysaccharide export system protein LptA